MTVPGRLLGRRVLAVEDLTRPWTTAVRTSRATLDDGLVVVHQAGLSTATGRAGIARRMRLGKAVGMAAPGLRAPAVLDGDPAADPPFLLTAFVPGRSGGEMLGTAADAAVLGRGAGEAARALAGVSPRDLRTALPRTWAAPGGLRGAAERWLAVAPVEPRDRAIFLGILDRIPGLFDRPPVLAHGDLAPVNLVLDGERLVGLLDLERLRVSPVGFDAAWFRLMVRHHHPERWAAAGPAFLPAAGPGGSPGGWPGELRRLDDLAVLACLEAAASLPRRAPARTDWLARAGAIVRGELPEP